MDAVYSLVVASNDKLIITCQSTPSPFALEVGGLIRLDLYGVKTCVIFTCKIHWS